VFIEYDTPEQAAAAIKSKDGHALDKLHKLRVNRFTDVEKYANASEEYTPPEIEPYVEKVLTLRDFSLMKGTSTKLVKRPTSTRPILHL
jgi:hypothetical protein